MSLLRKKDEETDGIEVTWEDQKHICSFAKYNTRNGDIQEQLKGKQQEKEYFDDLEMELELADEDSPTPTLYKIGEAFFNLSVSEAMKRLKADRKVLDKEIRKLEGRGRECEKEMGLLKAELKSKFGNSINLESNPTDD